MKTITVLFLILLPILLSAEYEPSVSFKYPFETTTEYPDTIGDTLIIIKDSLSRNTSLTVTLYGSSGCFAIDSSTTNDSGFAQLSFDKWNDDSPIDTADIDSVTIELLNAYRYDSVSGEFENPVIYTFEFSDIWDAIERILILLLSLIVQDNPITIGNGPYEFKFAIMSDMHIGSGSKNFEGGSYNDPWKGTSGFQEDAIKVVERNQIISHYINSQQVKFTIALGDITDSGERAELECARELVLKSLNTPYIPVFGNHDTWSYFSMPWAFWIEESHSDYPCGNSFKLYGFGDYYETLKTLPPFGNWSECYHLNNVAEDVEGSADSYFFNFSFDYQNYHFICSDWNSRQAALSGGGSMWYPERYGYTRHWFFADFDQALSENRKIIILAHHPLSNDKVSSLVGLFFDEFLHQELRNRHPEIDKFDYWFGGHHHKDFTTSTDEVHHYVEVGAAEKGWCKTVAIKDDYFLDLHCTLDPSGENYVFEGIINDISGSSNQYYFKLLNEEVTLQGSGSINKTYIYNYPPGTENVTLDAVINSKHYTITKAFEIPYANYLLLQNETVNTTKTYEATNYIDAGTGFHIASSGDVTTKAGNYMRLSTGFEAQDGCEFRASIDASLKENPPGLSSMQTEDMSISIPKTTTAKKPSPTQTPTKKEIPTVFTCAQNRPNPFVRNTTISYGLPNTCDVNLTVFNIAGQAVKTLVNANQSAGFKSVSWDGCNSAGVQMPQGIYFYAFKAGDFEKHHKMILLK